jgi:hypothetical protein
VVKRFDLLPASLVCLHFKGDPPCRESRLP